MTNPTTQAEIRDGGAPLPLPGNEVAATVEPARRPVTPELRLLHAVLEQAIHDLDRARRLPHGRREIESAKLLRWFRSRDVRWPFAFESICATIGLDAGAVRAVLLAAGPPAARRRPPVGDQRLSA